VHVGVAPLRRGVGDALDVAQDGPELVLLEARGEDLEHRAQPPGGDAHGVDALDVARVHTPVGVLEELARPDADDPRAAAA
jgi:hypothetical protein